jgi:hypothetical protein
MMDTELVSETSVELNNLSRVSAGEDVAEFYCREGVRSVWVVP